MTRWFYRTKLGRKYHRDRQCSFLRHAVMYGLEIRFEAEEPGIGMELYGYGACYRCGV
jgi:hypothetical protein